MSYAILKFKLPEEQELFNTAYCAIDLNIVITKILDELRRRRKYKDETVIRIDDMEKFIWECLRDNGINL